MSVIEGDPSPNLENPFQQEQSLDNQEPSDFGNQFLKDVDEQDRLVVAKYIKQWDGNVTKKFQDYSEKLKGYEALGDVDTLSAAQGLFNDLQQDPVGFYNNYKDYLLENAQVIQEQFGIDDIKVALGLAQQMEEQEVNNPGGNPNYEGLPETFVNEYSEMKSQLEELRNNQASQMSAQEEQEKMKMLDSALEMMHNDHGDFDDNFVLSQLAAGKTQAEAVKAYQSLTESIINSHKKAPNLLSGNGGTSLDQVDKTKLNSSKARKELGAQLLSNLNN